MRTLVCQSKGPLSTVRLYVDQETLVDGEFEAWTILTGKQVMCVERRLHKLLERHYLGGAYDQGALYAFEYGELCAILRDQLGPTDRERYLKLQQQAKAIQHGPPWQRTKAVSYVSWRLAGLLGFILYKCVSTIVFFGIVAALLSIFKKHR